ncbi:hypothetical protein Y032_0031g2270 [Ancylostoma ceylanicum]|uniref:PDZ domain-containing protein n=1 Tax=Ancylostoma ceylanicum TaxID=53326 RepID=A0A016UQA0_9BILA|nr:hypothetical protein Y032_0031g2270 [Ancylostoma ceylanicum]
MPIPAPGPAPGPGPSMGTYAQMPMSGGGDSFATSGGGEASVQVPAAQGGNGLEENTITGGGEEAPAPAPAGGQGGYPTRRKYRRYRGRKMFHTARKAMKMQRVNRTHRTRVAIHISEHIPTLGCFISAYEQNTHHEQLEKLIMERSAAAQDQDPEKYGMTPERQRNFVVRPGFAYFLVILRVTQGLRFGLGIKHYRNMVIVSEVEEGTLSADALRVADRIIDVNGVPVTDKNVAKSLILRSLQNQLGPKERTRAARSRRGVRLDRLPTWHGSII